MGTAQTHALGRERKIYVDAESTYGTQTFPAGTDAAKVLSADLGSPAHARTDRADNRATRSTVERIAGAQGPAEWSIEANIIPSGTVGTPPDLHAAYSAAMGTYTNTPATSDAYTLTSTQGAHGSLTILDQISSTLAETIDGCIVQEMSLKGGGGDPPTVSFSGVGANHVTTARTALDAALSGGETEIIVEHQEAAEVGSLIQIGTSDGTAGAGHQVTAKGKGIGAANLTTGSGLDDATSGGTYTGTTDRTTYIITIDAAGTPDTFTWTVAGAGGATGVAITGAAQTLGEGVAVTFAATTGHTLADAWTINVSTETAWTVTPAVTGAQADGLTVIPFSPTETTAGSPAPGTLGSITLGGSSFPCLAWEVTLNNNHLPFHDEAFQAQITDYTEGYRDVTGQLTVRARADQVRWLGKRKEFATHALSIAVGTVAGKICTIACPTVELEFNGVDKPNEDSAVITLPFKALGTNNELSITFT